MKIMWSDCRLSIVWLTLILLGCNPAAPTPDLVATRVAVEKAAAATLTAEAVANQPAAPTNTSPPVENNITPTLASPTDTPPPTPTCSVVPSTLNIRSGPGVDYVPPLAAVAQGTILRPIAYSAVGYPGGSWIQVEEPAGWVNADPQFVNCNINPASLPPAANIPPTPTATITPTPIPAPPTPTPTPELSVFFEPPGGGNKNIDGYVVFPGYGAGQLNVNDLVFKDKLVFRVVAYDTGHSKKDGAGIESVTFTILDSNDKIVHERTERTAGYCVFGGGEPACNVWVFGQHNYRWPEPYHNQPIVNGDYKVKIQIKPHQGDTANWSFNFRIENAPQQGQANLVNLSAQITQIGPGNLADTVKDALVFQVKASANSGNDGAGIDRVDLRIFKEGQEVYQRTERNAAYCAFGGGEPHCNIWVFAEHENSWPDGRPVESGPHLLQATVYAKNGQTTTVETIIQIESNGN